jgi:multimeric flavodoxin WrbA
MTVAWSRRVEAADSPASNTGNRPPPRLILGIACSPRRGKTTAQAVEAALAGARGVGSGIRTALIDLGGLRISGWSPEPSSDDFDAILPRLKDPDLAGLIVGSPCYFRSLSALCKAFIERCMPLRDSVMVLKDKPVGALAVAGNRNGGQELVIQQIHAGLISYGMIPVGGNSPAMLGGTVWNSAGDDVGKDEIGLASARLLGAHVAELALRLGR